MRSTYYDPDSAPNPGDWLALSESERIRLVQSFHVSARIKTPSMKAHAAFHAVVENQIATGFGPSCRAAERLQKEGLSRHDAIHAIGFIVAKFLHESVTKPSSEPVETMQGRMNAAIEAPSASQWKASGDA
jgi:hypothetical protein